MVALVLAAVLLAALAAAQKPVNDEPTGLVESECYTCHAQGGGSFGPPLRAMYAIIPPANLTVPVGEDFPYPVDVLNTWTAELRGIDAVLDLRDAPSLGFASGQDPVLRSDAGTLDGFATDERTQRFEFDVPVGTTTVLASVRPAAGAVPLPPDLVLRVWSAAASPETDGPRETDNTGTGGTERIRFDGAGTISSLGYGVWTIDVVQPVARDNVAAFVPQDFRLDLYAYSNTTGERVQPTSTQQVLDGQDPRSVQNASLLWRLRADERPGGNETITITVDLTAYYDHPGTTSGGRDDWRYTKSLQVGVFEEVLPDPDDPDPADPDVVLDPTQRDPDADLEAEDAIPWDRIGEIIGYVSAFLLVFSMITGGVFGKTSRRWQNKIFRSAKRRVAFHNFVSYLLTVFALAHTVLFLVEPGFPWTLGIIWGSIAMVAMVLLGVTGALQVPMVRSWGFGAWRWTHLILALVALVFTMVHMLLDGANFTEVAEWVGWQDPFAA